MIELSFPGKFISWVMECAKTVNYSVMFNGEPTAPFNAARGLRQGDLTSPFLFDFSMEYLSRLLKGLSDVKEFHHHPRCAKLGITHLCFANDLLLFARGDLSYVTVLNRCFTQFSKASGLQANLRKSLVFLGASHKLKEGRFCIVRNLHVGICHSNILAFHCLQRRYLLYSGNTSLLKS